MQFPLPCRRSVGNNYGKSRNTCIAYDREFSLNYKVTPCLKVAHPSLNYNLSGGHKVVVELQVFND